MRAKKLYSRKSRYDDLIGVENHEGEGRANCRGNLGRMRLSCQQRSDTMTIKWWVMLSLLSSTRRKLEGEHMEKATAVIWGQRLGCCVGSLLLFASFRTQASPVRGCTPHRQAQHPYPVLHGVFSVQGGLLHPCALFHQRHLPISVDSICILPKAIAGSNRRAWD